MSRLRRVELHSQFFFITRNLRRSTRQFSNDEFSLLVNTIDAVRRKANTALCAYCLMPDHWHAIVLPPETASVSHFMMRIKISAQRQISRARGSHEGIWQSRFYDHILRTRQEFDETVEYIRQNPARKGLVENATDWLWSSATWHVDGTGPVVMDDVCVPLNPHDRI